MPYHGIYNCHILDHIKKDPKFYRVRVEEAINTTNSRKGGVALMP